MAMALISRGPFAYIANNTWTKITIPCLTDATTPHETSWNSAVFDGVGGEMLIYERYTQVGMYKDHKYSNCIFAFNPYSGVWGIRQLSPWTDPDTGGTYTNDPMIYPATTNFPQNRHIYGNWAYDPTNRKIRLCAGAMSESTPDLGVSLWMWTLDPVTNAWSRGTTELAGGSNIAYEGCSTWDSNNGRWVHDYGMNYTHFGYWTPGTDTFSEFDQPAAIGNDKSFANMVYIPTIEKILWFGGRPYGEASHDHGYLIDCSTESYNFSDALSGTLPGPRCSHGMAYDSINNIVLIYGGYANLSTPTPLDDTWIYDPNAGTFTDLGKTGPTPVSTQNHYMRLVYDSAHDAFLMARSSNGIHMDEMWVFKYRP